MANSDARKDGGIWETIKTIFWALVIAGVFRTLFFQPFWIPSGSMKDTWDWSGSVRFCKASTTTTTPT